MEKQQISIAGYKITQISETTFEAANPQEKLDFYFDAEDPEEVEVTVFDSLISNDSDKEPHLGVWYAENLKEAVSDCMTFTRETMKGYEWFTNNKSDTKIN